jgi:hypothetical protein
MEDWRILQSAKVVHSLGDPCKTGILVGGKVYPIERDHEHFNGITVAEDVKLKNIVKVGAKSVDVIGGEVNAGKLVGKLYKGQHLVIAGKMYTVTEDTYPAAASVIIAAKIAPAVTDEIPAGTPVEILDGTRYV